MQLRALLILFHLISSSVPHVVRFTMRAMLALCSVDGRALEKLTHSLGACAKMHCFFCADVGKRSEELKRMVYGDYRRHLAMGMCSLCCPHAT